MEGMEWIVSRSITLKLLSFLQLVHTWLPHLRRHQRYPRIQRKPIFFHWALHTKNHRWVWKKWPQLTEITNPLTIRNKNWTLLFLLAFFGFLMLRTIFWVLLKGRCRVREKQTMKERERERCYKKNYIKKIIMMCKIVMREKMMWPIFMKSN